jgi:glycerate-2-kinase
LLKGVNGIIPETPKPGKSSFGRVHNFIIGDNAIACEAIHRRLERAGIASKILSTSVEIDARALGRSLASMARKLRTRPRRGSGGRGVIVGGETTVRLAGKGKGGRNQEVALAGVSDIAGFAGSAIAAIGTDGVDGNSDAAGAIIDGNTFPRAKRRKLDPDKFLRNNDSYTFFSKLDDTLLTGPTGTNVGDVYVALSVK